MSGIKPQEGLQAQASELYQVPTVHLGVWAGTWDGQDTVTYTQADSVFTKVSTEIPLPDPTITLEGSSVLIEWPQQEFTDAGVTANGYYVAAQYQGTFFLAAIERDPNARDLTNAYRVTARIRERYV